VPEVPVIDVGPLVDGTMPAAVGEAIDAACRSHGFFSVVGHGIDPTLLPRLDSLARAFFALPEGEKAAIAMAHGGRAWRGWFPLGGELTSGVPDRKEGIYFGAELPADDPRVAAGLPLHGANLVPAQPAELGPTVLDVLDALTALGHQLLAGMALGLGLPPSWFRQHLTADPTVLFRIFHYPPELPGGDASEWGVAEHTDYGLLTLLHQDESGGLEVRAADGTWLEVPPLAGALVCNLGDMLERMSGGRYRSTPHRVRSPGDRDRISCPFFFDPSWDAEVAPLPLAADDRPAEPGTAHQRWDGADVFEWEGTYGAYLSAKVAKVFPDLGAEVLEG
jgi:isopenicillin N synthase-like dioxygenase